VPDARQGAISVFANGPDNDAHGLGPVLIRGPTWLRSIG
jgi:hypothetical protein